MEEQSTNEISDFEKKGENIWAELVNNSDVRVEDVVKQAEDSLRQRKMDSAGLLFDAAAKKLEMRKLKLLSVADTDVMGDVVKNQLILMTKAADAVLKYLDKAEDILLFKKLDETAEKSFNEYSVALQFVRKLLVDATEIRKHTKFAAKLKEHLNDADILLMKSYFKPKFNSKDENVVNRKLCGKAMKDFLDANGEEVLNGDDAHDLWLILQQLDHPIYRDFVEQQVAFGELRFPDNIFIVDPYGSACFKTIGEALEFAIKDAKFSYVRYLLGSEKGDARTRVSILVQPETYKDDLKWKGLPKQMDIDVVGNVGVRKYCEAKGVEHPSRVVLKQTQEKLGPVKDLTPWMATVEGTNVSLKLARLEIINESTDPLRPTLFVSPGCPVEVVDSLFHNPHADTAIVKGKNAVLKMTGCAIEKSAKAYQVSADGRLSMTGCRIEDIRGGIGEEEGAGGCDALEAGVIQIAETSFVKSKQIFFAGGSRGIFNKCEFKGDWTKSFDTTGFGSLYKGVCLEDESRVSINNSTFERFEVAVFALKEGNHVALGHNRITDSVKVGAEICENASATLRNNEIDADLVMALFSNSNGKVTLENNTSSAKAAQRRKAAAASVLVDSESKPPTMIGPQYEIMDITCGPKEDTNTMMKRLMKEKKEEMAKEKAAAEAAAAQATPAEQATPLAHEIPAERKTLAIPAIDAIPAELPNPAAQTKPATENEESYETPSVELPSAAASATGDSSEKKKGKKKKKKGGKGAAAAAASATAAEE